jgi:hypothetical protein
LLKLLLFRSSLFSLFRVANPGNVADCFDAIAKAKVIQKVVAGNTNAESDSVGSCCHTTSRTHSYFMLRISSCCKEQKDRRRKPGKRRKKKKEKSPEERGESDSSTRALSVFVLIYISPGFLCSIKRKK